MAAEGPAPQPKVRPPRRLRGAFDEASINEIAQIPGVGRPRAEELCLAGYASTSKLRAATEEDLAKVPGVGLGGAKVIKESLQFIAVLPQRWTKDQAMAEEYACPLCGCVTSVFSQRCHDCGAEFEEAELDDQLRTELGQMGPKAELAFYEIRLMENRSDPALWYARGRLVLEMGNVPEALSSWDRALEIQPAAPRVLLARASLFTGLNEVGRAAKHLRAAVAGLIREPSKEVPKPTETAEPEKPRSGAKVEAQIEEPSETAEVEQPAKKAEPEPEVEGPTDEAEPAAARAAESRKTRRKPSPPPVAAEPAEGLRSLEDLQHILARSRPDVPAAPARPLERLTLGPEEFEESTGRIPPVLRARARRGLVNGEGLINGRGRVNGLMNRSGFVNGAELTPVRMVRRVPVTRYSLVAFALAIAALVSVLALPPPAPPAPRIVVDGNIADWSGIPGFQDFVPAGNPNVALRSYAILVENGSVFFRLSVAGSALGDGAGIDGFYVLFDADGDPLTGYVAHGLGAEAILAVDGGSGSVVSTDLYAWPSASADRYNWSEFSRFPRGRAAVSGPVLEAQFPTDDLVLAAGFRVLFLGNDFEGHEAVASVAIGSQSAALLVTQSTAPPAGLVAASGDPLLRLTFQAFGDLATVTDVRLGPASNGTLGPAPLPPPVAPGAPVTADVTIAFTPAEAGRLTAASVASVTADAPVTIRGSPVTAYLQAAPGGRRIDGYFGEWNATAADGDAVPIANSDVDIARFGTGLVGSSAAVYADTVGDLLAGTATPELRARPGPAPSPPRPPGIPIRRTGEDLFRAYVDPDSRDANGTPVLGISAEYLLEVRGIHGRITSMWAYQWSGIWQRTNRLVAAATDRQHIEASIDLSGVALFDPEVVLEVVDWTLGGDFTVPAISRVSGLQVRAPEDDRGVFGNPPGVQLLLAPALTGGLTADGSCGDAGYAAAATSSQANMTIKAGNKANFVWICVTARFDTTNDATDTGYVYFDRDDSGGSSPTAGDRRFSITPGGSIVASRGGGGDWVACPGSNNPGPVECDNANAAGTAFSTNRTYEFKIALTDVWNTTTPSSNQRAGFAVRLSDANNGTVYKWGSTVVDVTSTGLNTWGHLDIPEFGDIGPPAAAAAVLGFGLWRHRRSRRRAPSVAARRA